MKAREETRVHDAPHLECQYWRTQVVACGSIRSVLLPIHPGLVYWNDQTTEHLPFES